MNDRTDGQVTRDSGLLALSIPLGSPPSPPGAAASRPRPAGGAMLVETGAGAAPPSTRFPPSDDPVFAAFSRVRLLLQLVPDGPGGHTRLSECLESMRAKVEDGLFPGRSVPHNGGSSLVSLSYPERELNEFVAATKDVMLSLLGSVNFEPLLKRRLADELRRPGNFLERDDRGTFLGAIHPTGPTPQKERNNARLDALAAFLHALRREPYAVVGAALAALRPVAVPHELLSADLSAPAVTYRGKVYCVSLETCYFIKLLIEADGGLVSGGDVQKAAGSTSKPRPDRLKANLPDGVLKAIETDSQGSRLRPEKLLAGA